MTDTVLFDLGGTLVRYYERSAFPSVLEQAIIEVRDYLHQEGLVEAPPADLWQRVQQENYEAEDHCVRPLEQRLVRIFRLNHDVLSADRMMTMCRRFVKPILALRHCYEDVTPTLKKLRAEGLKTAIVSNTPWGSPAQLWREEVEQLGLADLVDAGVFCRDVGWRKPAPQIFEFALDRLKATADRCVFVGDDPRWDVVGPRAVGMEAVLIQRRGPVENADRVGIRSLHQLWDRLQ